MSGGPASPASSTLPLERPSAAVVSCSAAEAAAEHCRPPLPACRGTGRWQGRSGPVPGARGLGPGQRLSRCGHGNPGAPGSARAAVLARLPSGRGLAAFGPGHAGFGSSAGKGGGDTELPMPVPWAGPGALRPPRPSPSVSFLPTHCFPGLCCPFPSTEPAQDDISGGNSIFPKLKHLCSSCWRTRSCGNSCTYGTSRPALAEGSEWLWLQFLLVLVPVYLLLRGQKVVMGPVHLAGGRQLEPLGTAVLPVSPGAGTLSFAP